MIRNHETGRSIKRNSTKGKEISRRRKVIKSLTKTQRGGSSLMCKVKLFFGFGDCPSQCDEYKKTGTMQFADEKHAAFGQINFIEPQKGQHLLVKIQNIDIQPDDKEINIDREQIFRDEVKMLQRVNKIEPPIAPKYIDSWTCSNKEGTKYGYIVMENWLSQEYKDAIHGDLSKLPSQHPNVDTTKLIIDLIDKLDILHKNDILHDDIRLPNMLFRLDKNSSEIEVTLIDFGLSQDISKIKPIKRLEEEFYEFFDLIDAFADGFGIDGLSRKKFHNTKNKKIYEVLDTITNERILEKLRKILKEEMNKNSKMENITNLIKRRFSVINITNNTLNKFINEVLLPGYNKERIKTGKFLSLY